MSEVAAVLGGFLVGLLSGIIGIGGGTLLVPLMVVGFGFTQHRAQGTSLLAIIPTAVVGAFTHHRAGRVDLKAAGWMGLLGAVGALGGAAMALHLHPQLLGRLFGLFLLLSALRLWPRRARSQNQG